MINLRGTKLNQVHLPFRLSLRLQHALNALQVTDLRTRHLVWQADSDKGSDVRDGREGRLHCSNQRHVITGAETQRHIHMQLDLLRSASLQDNGQFVRQAIMDQDARRLFRQSLTACIHACLHGFLRCVYFDR